MNIFALHDDPTICATYHVDSHVVKMPLETAQLLCTTVFLTDNVHKVPYKPTHANHPCAVWARQSKENYTWLVKLGLALCKEYTYRYNKVHICEEVIRNLPPPYNLPDIPRTPFVTAMPIECVVEDNPVESYRNYYKQFKTKLAFWTKRNYPWWWNK